MKEFNLELAKAGHPVCTRDGKPARIICFDAKGSYPIVALLYNNDEEFVRTFTNEGFYSTGEESDYDLMMASKVKDSEEIRKELIQYLIESTELPNGKYSRADFFAWLNKQGKLIDEYEDKLDRCACHYFNKGYKAGKKSSDRVKLMQEWSEEDERKLQLFIAMCDDAKEGSVTYSTMYREMEELKTWFKDRLQQQNK